MEATVGRILLPKLCFTIPILGSRFVVLCQALCGRLDLCWGGQVVAHRASGSLQGLKAI